jgi:hypothetical protein
MSSLTQLYKWFLMHKFISTLYSIIRSVERVVILLNLSKNTLQYNQINKLILLFYETKDKH